MEGKRPSILSLVLVPALITLAVTVLRLVGELKGWDPLLVGTKEGGGGGGLIAIIWLVLVFGLWFGFRLQRTGSGTSSPKRVMAIGLVAVAVLIGGFVAMGAAGLISFPDPEHPVVAHGALYIAAGCATAVLVAFLAWPRAALALLIYALLARIPVVILTWWALRQPDWDTHYTKIAPGFVPPAADEVFAFLALPQVTFWPALTVTFGVVLAGLGAMFAGRSKS